MTFTSLDLRGRCVVCAADCGNGTAVACACGTAYCSPTCRAADATHDARCAAVEAAGGPTAYAATAAYDEAAALAIKESERVAGAACYICLEADDDVVRACACRGSSGFAHVSCLVEQARMAVEFHGQKGVARWSSCRLCSQQHHGALRLALGRACWRAYCDRAEPDETRGHAMTILGTALRHAGRYAEALVAFEADLAWMRKFYPHDEANVCVSEQNVANTMWFLGRHDEALKRQRATYAKQVRLSGAADRNSLAAAVNLSSSLFQTGRFREAQDLLRDLVPRAEAELGQDDRVALKVRHALAQALYRNDRATRAERRAAVGLLEPALARSRRVFGADHPFTMIVAEERDRAEASLQRAEPTAAARPAGPADDVAPTTAATTTRETPRKGVLRHWRSPARWGILCTAPCH